MKERVFCFVRHGQTNWNVARRIQGHTDIELNDTGRAEARQVAKELKEIPFGACFASDLKRASETAEIIIEGRGLELIRDSRLREQYHGPWEGLYWEQYSHISLDKREGVESHSSIVERVFSLLEEIVREVSEEKILMVAHGALIRTIILELDPSLDRKKPPSVQNGGMLEITFHHGKWLIKSMKGIT